MCQLLSTVVLSPCCQKLNTRLLVCDRMSVEMMSGVVIRCVCVCVCPPLPPLHLGEIHSHQSVGHGLLVQVTAVSSDEG